MFRRPGEHSYTSLGSDSGARIIDVRSIDSLSGAFAVPGFIVHPFLAGGETPALSIPAERVCSGTVPPTGDALSVPVSDCRRIFRDGTTPEAGYLSDFKRFHKAVLEQDFVKLVLSRNFKVKLSARADPARLFFETCNAYPDVTVMLFSTPQTGMWLSATPEPLLEYEGGLCHTAAIAGTMPCPPEFLDGRQDGVEVSWSGKDRKEQKVVEDFISDAVAPYSTLLVKRGPYTVRAGQLVHLKTDFTFQTGEDNLGRIVSSLHPTPAVCGFPQEKARKFIADNEHGQRRYYSGFAGPVKIGGRTELFVNLRCAELKEEGMEAVLYAGGGIMPESECLPEYRETGYKMATMFKILGPYA